MTKYQYKQMGGKQFKKRLVFKHVIATFHPYNKKTKTKTFIN
jgi:sRNA-binding regulator protein Hfq